MSPEPQRIARNDRAGTGAPHLAATARECLTFRLGAEHYAIDILKVQEIRGYTAPTRIAHAPPCVKGVLDLRGTIVPVIDLRQRFGLEHQGHDASTVIVVLNLAGRTVGAVVDSVSEVVALQADQIRPAPDFDAALDAGHIDGLASLTQGGTERLLILIDIERLLAGTGIGPAATELH